MRLLAGRHFNRMAHFRDIDPVRRHCLDSQGATGVGRRLRGQEQPARAEADGEQRQAGGQQGGTTQRSPSTGSRQAAGVEPG